MSKFNTVCQLANFRKILLTGEREDACQHSGRSIPEVSSKIQVSHTSEGNGLDITVKNNKLNGYVDRSIASCD